MIHTFDLKNRLVEPSMIRNLFILDNNGHGIVTGHFGKCHELGDDYEKINGFISALHSMSQTLAGHGVDEISLGPIRFVILTERDLLFAVVIEDEGLETTKEKISRIADIFIEVYGSKATDLREADDHSMFQGFPELLVEREIVPDDCGLYKECEGCPTAHKPLEMGQFIRHVHGE